MAGSNAQARRHLAERFRRVRPLVTEQRPAHGWVRAIRDALGMSSPELARRMDVNTSTVTKIERSEANGSVKLESLQRVADALDCDFVYFFVPRQDLGDMVQARAREKAVQVLGPVAHHGRLEDQTVSDADREAQVDELAARFIDVRGLWTDDE